MKFICVAPNSPQFAWQVDLAFYQHIKSGYDKEDFIVIVPKLNMPGDSLKNLFSPQIYTIWVNSYWEFLNLEPPSGLLMHPIAIQTSLMQINIDDNEIYCLNDPDTFIIFKKDFNLSDNTVIQDPIYETWHMFLNSKNDYLKKTIVQPCTQSGFVPIIVKGRDLKRILPEWVKLHLECYNLIENNSEKWWAGMYSWNLACAKCKLNVIEQRLCVIPGRDLKITKDIFCIHYSTPVLNFDKKRFHKYSEKEKIEKIIQSNPINDVDICFFSVLNDWLKNQTIL